MLITKHKADGEDQKILSSFRTGKSTTNFTDNNTSRLVQISNLQ